MGLHHACASDQKLPPNPIGTSILISSDGHKNRRVIPKAVNNLPTAGNAKGVPLVSTVKPL